MLLCSPGDPAADSIIARLASLRSEMPVLVALYDPGDRLRYANQAFRATFAVATDETPSWEDIVRRNKQAGIGTIIQSHDFDAWVISTRSRRGKVPHRGFEMDLADGRWLWMTEITDAEGWMLCVASDITSIRPDERELRQARDFALRASQTDDLTGVANRRSMMAALGSLSDTIAGDASAIGCVCLIDLDRFKEINDSYGHQVGDDILVEFARFIQGIARRRDSFGRIGGEEFMLILPDTALAQACGMMDDMLGKLRATRLISSLPGLSVTCSVGIAEIPGGDVRELYSRVDKALYGAKHGGRDRLEIAPLPGRSDHVDAF
jgi:diguanylate cyclase (GGDEF)-like protein